MQRPSDSAYAVGATANVPISAVTLRKVTWRLIPFLLILCVIAWLDRVNVSFAGLQMNADLGFSSTVFGFGSGIFFLGYCLFEIPSNIILERVGARIWISRIMVTWGLISAGLMFVRTPAAFYVLRSLLGVAEAGFFPGVIYYLSLWYPTAHRARAIAAFMTAVPVTGLIGGPLSGALLELEGFHGLAGWQWLFLLEGLRAGNPGHQRPFLSEGSTRNNALADSNRTRLAGRNTCCRAKSLRAKAEYSCSSD